MRPWSITTPASRAPRRPSYPDATQFDPKSEYYDAKSTAAAPRWLNVDVRLVKKTRFVPLPSLRAHRELAKLVVLQRGNRLSITPVTPAQWKFITTKLMKEKL